MGGDIIKHGEPETGLLGLARLKFGAWRAEQATEAELRLLDCRRRLDSARRAATLSDIEGRAAAALAELESKLSLAQAELDGRRRLLQGAIEVEELEGELALRRRLRQATPEGARQVLGAEVETQRLLLERERLRRERLTGSPPASLPAPPAPAPGHPGPPRLEAHVSDRDVETLALRAVTRFAALEPAEAERQWARWRAELASRLPPYAAAEVARRADELRGMAG